MSDTRRRLSVLNTRPAEDADELSSALFKLGFEVIGEPLLTVRYSDTEPPPLDTYQAVVFTSRNGVRAFARASEERNALVFAVGDATSREAQTIGFKNVRSASGNVGKLARLITGQLDPDEGPLLHVSATVSTGDLASRLNAVGFDVDKTILYETKSSEQLSTRTVSLFKNNMLDVIVLFSPRTARTFVGLMKQSEMLGVFSRLVVVCLSEAVAAELGKFTGDRVLTATEPTLESMLQVFRNIEVGDLENG